MKRMVFLISLIIVFVLGTHPVEWAELLSGAWTQSATANRIIGDSEAGRLQYTLFKKTMLPAITFRSIQAITRASARNITIIGAPPSTDNHEILSVAPAITLAQKLPGGGLAESSLTYRFDYDRTMEAYRHTPGWSLSLSQPLGPGFFGLGDDPWIQAAKLDRRRSDLNYMKQCGEFVLRCLTVARDWDLACCETHYREAYEYAAVSRLQISKELASQGRLSMSELQKFELAASQARVALVQARFAEKRRRIEWKELFYLDPFELNSAQRDDLLDLMRVSALPGQGWDIPLGYLDLEAARQDIRKDEVIYAPVFSASISIKPDTALDFYFLDLSEAWSHLSSSPSPWDISFSIGLAFSPDYSEIKKTKRTIYDLDVKARRLMLEEAEIDREREYERISALKAELIEWRAYLDAESLKLEKIVEDMKSLFEKAMISEADLLDVEAECIKLANDCVAVTWELILAEYQLAALEGYDFSVILSGAPSY
jgi:hypothetical protein